MRQLEVLTMLLIDLVLRQLMAQLEFISKASPIHFISQTTFELCLAFPELDRGPHQIRHSFIYFLLPLIWQDPFR